MSATTFDSPLKLRSTLSPLLRRTLDDSKFLQQIAGGFGSPLNVVFPDRLTDNVRTCHAALSGFDVRARVFLAHKPNRSRAMIAKAATIAGLGLDVASEGELRNGLTNGFNASSIEATGPKNSRYLRLAIQHGVLINVDNISELRQITQLQSALGITKPVSVVVRLNSVVDDGRTTDTKFGIAPRQVGELIAWLIDNTASIDFRGFAFHLTFSTARERARATEQLISHLIEALRCGLAPSVINIGGGFKVSFLDDREDWDRYVSALKSGLMGTTPPLSWNSTTFGMDIDGRAITGTANLTSFHRSDTIHNELTAFLRTPLRTQNRSVGDFLTENMIELHLEPGRALFDQCGLTVARVNFSKDSANGASLVGLDMNRSNLDVSDREFFVDPIVISTHPKDTATPTAVYFSGNLCLPADMITRHLTYLDAKPATGDLIVFPNTAGYFMDFIESETLLQRTAPKVAVAVVNDELRWFRDEDYDPLFGVAA